MINHLRFLPGLLMASAMTFFTVAAHAQHDQRDVVRDARGAVVVNTFGHCVRTQWTSNMDECAPQAVTKMVQQRAKRKDIAVEDRTVYFDFNKSTLKPEAREKLDSLAGILKSDSEVTHADIAGYADRIGSETYNDRLSQRRALTVKDYLARRGYVNTNVTETRWLGESESASKNSCAGITKRSELIACLAPDRKVEAEIHYVSPSASR